MQTGRFPIFLEFLLTGKEIGIKSSGNLRNCCSRAILIFMGFYIENLPGLETKYRKNFNLN